MYCCSKLTAPQLLCQQMSQRRHLSQQNLLCNSLLWSYWWTVEFFEQLFPFVAHCTLSALLPWYQPLPLGIVLTCPLTSKGFVLLSGLPRVTSCIPEPHTETSLFDFSPLWFVHHMQFSTISCHHAHFYLSDIMFRRPCSSVSFVCVFFLPFIYIFVQQRCVR